MKQVNPSVFWPVVGVLVVWLAALTWSFGQCANGGGVACDWRTCGGVRAWRQFAARHGVCPNHAANLQMQMEAREKQLQEDALPLQEEAQELLSYANRVRHRTMNWRSPSVGFGTRGGLRTLQRAAEQDMFVAEQNMQAVMAEALRRHLEEHAREEGIDFVLNWGLSGEGVLYGTEPWDITADVLARINAAHPIPFRPIGKRLKTRPE